MSVVVITPPAPVLSLDQIKRQLRIEADDASEDELLVDLAAAATAQIDGPGGWLGRALGEQTLELARGAWPWECGLELPYGPAREIVSVVQDGSALFASLYRLDAGGRLRAVVGQSIPVASAEPDAVRIRWKAGWAMSPAQPAANGSPAVPARWTGPAGIRHALLMMVARLFAQRGEDVAGSLVEDRAIAALLSPHRLFSL